MPLLHRKLVTATAINPPLAVTEEELTAQCRAAGQPSDQILPYLYAAQAYIETVRNLRLLRQTWAVYLDRFPEGNAIALPFPPLAAVTHVKYTPAGQAQLTLSTDAYGVSIVRTPGEIILKPNQLWPSATLETVDPIEIQFECGWASASAVPYDLRQAIRFLAAMFYQQREGIVIESGAVKTPIEVPFGISALMANWGTP
jgi:uncharacterized phiE125 gp8 family phage protein